MPASSFCAELDLLGSYRPTALQNAGSVVGVSTVSFSPSPPLARLAVEQSGSTQSSEEPESNTTVVCCPAMETNYSELEFGRKTVVMITHHEDVTIENQCLLLIAYDVCRFRRSVAAVPAVALRER